jgi:hypothetical protein
MVLVRHLVALPTRLLGGISPWQWPVQQEREMENRWKIDPIKDKEGSIFIEYNKFADAVEAKFPHAIITCNSYAGGVPGMSANLREEDYADVVAWLTDLYGSCRALKRWHSQQRKGFDILEFFITPHMERNKMYHVNVIHMGTIKKKRYTLISWM